MEKRKLGRNGPMVPALGLGCMGMTGLYGEPNDTESIATIHRAIDLGINLIVTSDAYASGANEELVGRAIKGKRDRVLVATKFGNMGLSGFKLPEGQSGGHPATFRKPARLPSNASAWTSSISTDFIASIPRCRSRTRWAR